MGEDGGDIVDDVGATSIDAGPLENIFSCCCRCWWWLSDDGHDEARAERFDFFTVESRFDDVTDAVGRQGVHDAPMGSLDTVSSAYGIVDDCDNRGRCTVC